MSEENPDKKEGGIFDDLLKELNLPELPTPEGTPETELHERCYDETCTTCRPVTPEGEQVEMMTIPKKQYEGLVIANSYLNQQCTKLGGIARLLLGQTGSALCFNVEAVEDAIDDCGIAIMPSREVMHPTEILNLIKRGVDLDRSFVATLCERPAPERAALQEKRKEQRAREAAEKKNKEAQDLLKPGNKKPHLVLLGSSKGENI